MKYILTFLVLLVSIPTHAQQTPIVNNSSIAPGLVTTTGAFDERRTNASASTLLNITPVDGVTPIDDEITNTDIPDSPLVDDPGCCEPKSGEPLEPLHPIE